MTTQKETILVINPGSTSTKMAIYSGENEIHNVNMVHSTEDLATFSTINQQLPYRKRAVITFLQTAGVALNELAAIAVRGGIIDKLENGAYLVDRALAEASLTTTHSHPANLGPVIGYQLTQETDTGVNAYLYDAVSGCGTPDKIFLLTGLPELKRDFLTHVLNSRAIAIEQAKRDALPLQQTTYIVVHMGGGITTNLLKGGRILDIVGDDEGTFAPERAGRLPCRQLITLCYSGKYTEKEMQTLLRGKGGVMSYLGTKDLCEVEKRINAGNKEALLTLQAMALQIAKDIGSLATVVNGRVDKIIFTGGLAFSQLLTDMLKERVQFLAKTATIPGSFEMSALANGVLRILRKEEQAQKYYRTLPNQ